MHTSKWEKRKHVKGLHFTIFLTLGKFQFSKRKSLIDYDDSDNINNKHQLCRLAKHQLGMCITLVPSHLIWLFSLKKRDASACLIFSHFLDYILRVCQSLRDSFFYLGKLHWFLYLLLSYYYDPGMFIFCWSSNFVEKVVLNESMAAKMASFVSYLVYYNIVYRVSLNKLSGNFVGAIRTTTWQQQPTAGQVSLTYI